jgi:hypothetical protein
MSENQTKTPQDLMKDMAKVAKMEMVRGLVFSRQFADFIDSIPDEYRGEAAEQAWTIHQAQMGKSWAVSVMALYGLLMNYAMKNDLLIERLAGVETSEEDCSTCPFRDACPEYQSKTAKSAQLV